MKLVRRRIGSSAVGPPLCFSLASTCLTTIVSRQANGRPNRRVPDRNVARGGQDSDGRTVVRSETEGTGECTGISLSSARPPHSGQPQELSNVQYLSITIGRNFKILSLAVCVIVLSYVWTIAPSMEALSFRTG